MINIIETSIAGLYSHENIYFWCACERYRKLEDGGDRFRSAQEIVSKHLGGSATEPVNVDAVARSSTAENLQVSTAVQQYRREPTGQYSSTVQ